MSSHKFYGEKVRDGHWRLFCKIHIKYCTWKLVIFFDKYFSDLSIHATNIFCRKFSTPPFVAEASMPLMCADGKVELYL